jgi:glycosyltransferase involved in cell wall biosynthesis
MNTIGPDQTDGAVVSISAVVCAYTDARFDLLIACIEGLLEQLSSTDELIVVIDYNENLLATIADRYGGQALVLRNVAQRGLSGARNSGIAVAGKGVVAFVDDDATIAPEWAAKLREHYQDNSVAGVGGYASPIWPAGRPSWLPTEFDWVVGCSHRGLPTSIAPVRNFIGCNMSFRRAVFDEIGHFSTDVGRVGKRPVGCEETELCIRLAQHDSAARLLFDPSIKVDHSVSPDRVRVAYFVNRCFGEGISKYKVSGMVGSTDALSSERSYVTRVLPIAFVRGLHDMVFGSGDRRAAGARSAAILIGLAITTVGYGYSMLRTKWDTVR